MKSFLAFLPLLAFAGLVEAATEVDPWEGLRDWDHDVGESNGHGRQLQFTDFASCVAATGSEALCSCIFIDGNDLQYCSLCGGNLLASGFNFDDTENFGKWFTDETLLTVAQTGSYVGVVGITEYINFIYSQFFASYELMEPFRFKFLQNPNFAEDGECRVTIAINRRIALPSEYYDDECYRGTTGTTLYFTTTTPENGFIDVSRADVYYPAGFMAAFFGNMKEEPTIEWLCDTIYEYCRDTWDHNNFDNNPQKCYNNYQTLPRSEGDVAWIDGKSLGCKVIHATFVAANPYHCAHTSFVKQADPSNLIKCQKSYGYTAEELFPNGELDFFLDIGMNVYGFDETLVDLTSSQCS